MASAKPTGFIDFHIVGNERGVQRMLQTIDSALSPAGLAAFLYGPVGTWVKERAADRFAAEGDDVVGDWAPLKPATVDIRERSGFEGPHPINRRTGELEEYLTQGSIGVSAGPGYGSMRFPKDPPRDKGLKEKLSTAQRGKSYPRTVARPVLGLNERDLSQVLVMLAFHIRTEGASFGVRS